MADREHFLNPEDYMEPACPLCMDPPDAARTVDPIPQQRVVQKLDDYMSRRDYDGAERHLLYWLSEAERGNDLRGELLVRNELVGHYRKAGDRDKARAAYETARAEYAQAIENNKAGPATAEYLAAQAASLEEAAAALNP